jgi:NAD+ synthase (glutamine-hydrolysing)
LKKNTTQEKSFEMKIALAQINYKVGDFEGNSEKIIASIERSYLDGVQLVVFSELAVCGYPPLDLLEMDDFIEACIESVNQIAKHCKGISAIVGAPSKNPNSFGKKLYNSAYLLENQTIKNIYNKGLLPTYDVFDEYRYFEPATKFEVVEVAGKRVALTICEDLWNVDDRPLYNISPMGQLSIQKPDLIINIAASPFSWSHSMARNRTFSENAKRYKLPIFIVNQVGCHCELLFDGQSAVYNPRGGMVFGFKPFEEGSKILDLDTIIGNTSKQNEVEIDEEEKNRLIKTALVNGTRDYFGKLGLKKALVGLSGGLDSALTLVLATEALGSKNCKAVLLPGPHSSDHSVADAKQLAEKLGVPYDVISINPTVEALEKTLEPQFAGTTPGIAEENLQARARAIILMGIANKFGYVLLNTSNKSEAAVGYGTLYGDMCGGLAVIGDIYKTEAYSLARYINRNEEIIPHNTIEKPPSAELKPNQLDTDSLPPYEVLDAILYQYIEQQIPAANIIANGFDAALVNDVLRKVNSNEYKRKQSPPVLRVSTKAFGPGRRIPLVAKFDI